MSAASASRRIVDEVVGGVRAAAGCVTRHVPAITLNQYDPDRTHTISLGQGGNPVSLRGDAGPTGLHFDFWLDYRFGAEIAEARRRPGRILVVAYEYRLLDHDRRELLVYHWQPGPEFSGPDHPHLHVSASLAAQVTATTRRTIPLDKLHLATECVTFGAVIRMLIEELGVSPIRRDWRRRLTRADAALNRWQTDGSR